MVKAGIEAGRERVAAKNKAEAEARNKRIKINQQVAVERGKNRASTKAAIERSLNNARAKKQAQDEAKRKSKLAVQKSLTNSREKTAAYKAADQKVQDLKKQRAALYKQKVELSKDTYITVTRGNKTRTVKNPKTIGNSVKIKNIEGQLRSLDAQIRGAQNAKQQEQDKLYKTKKKSFFKRG